MLRWRLLVGLVSVLVLLLAVGGYSIWLILRLERDINFILKDNYESIRSAHQVRLAMLRLNVAYLKPTLADPARADISLLDTRYLPPLEKTITALRLLAKSPEEAAVAQTLTAQAAEYVSILRKALALPPESADEYVRLRSDLIARNLILTETTEEILAYNEAGMLQAQKNAQVAAVDTVKFLVGAMAVAIAVFVYTYYMLGRSLLSPIEDLTRSLDAIRARRFEPNLPIKSNDELGQLARSFNAMSDELQSYRRDTNETILRLNRALRDAIAAFPYPVMLLDADYAVWVTNEAAEEFLKYNEPPNEIPASIRERLTAVLDTHRNYLPEEPRDAMLFRLGEREVHYLPRILEIFSPEGDAAGAAIILVDVTRFRWLDDMKTSLISTISHEIKTPLTGIRMILHLLLEKNGGDLTKMQEEMVQAGCDDCERLLTTLNSLLDLSRIEAGRAQLDLQPIDPRTLLEETRAAFQTQARNRKVTLSIHASDRLPMVLADPARILHAIGNFASNALKFAPTGSIIRLTADPAGNSFVRLSVIDTGPGIPAALHSKIFDKFFRTPGQKVEGAGLGLAIAREIVKAHDGRVGVESIPDTATRFYCELPVAT